MAVVFEPGTRHQLELPGVGPISARPGASQLVYAGRLHSEAAFAALAGANPIPASSGQVTRHRLNRSGDRQLNRALHTTRWPGCGTTPRPVPMPPGVDRKARALGTSGGASLDEYRCCDPEPWVMAPR
jgi:hypothetical protein